MSFVMASPEKIPVKILISVIPIWTVERNLFGELASSKAAAAWRSPFLLAISNFDFREDMRAISDMEKIPLRITKKRIIKISI